MVYFRFVVYTTLCVSLFLTNPVFVLVTSTISQLITNPSRASKAKETFARCLG